MYARLSLSCHSGKLLAISLLLICPAPANAAESIAPRTNIGIESVVTVRWDGSPLEPRGDTNHRTRPVEVRVVGPLNSERGTTYELHFIGTRAGKYDLRDYLQRRDGQPIAGIDPIVVQVNELLAPDYLGDLASVADPSLPRTWPYRKLLWIFGVVWAALGLRFVVRRLVARRKPAVRPLLAAPTLADKLRPLVELGMQGRLSASEKAQLEQLLIGFWRQRLDGGDLSAFELLQRLRDDPVAGELLTQLEQWLHCPPQPQEVDLEQLLMPYRNATPATAETRTSRLANSWEPGA